MIPEGLINYLALLGWSFSADQDVFSREEMIEHFDITKVLANPARFDLKKCTAINAEQIRLLDLEDFTKRLVPYLYGNVSADFYQADLLKELAEKDPDLPKLSIYTPLVSNDHFDNLNAREQEILNKAAPLIQTRIQLLSEAREMLESFFIDDNQLTISEDAQKQLDKIANYQTTVERTIQELEKVDEAKWRTEHLHGLLSQVLVEELQLKPRLAFTPLRVAISGRTISPPLFESMEILGKSSVLRRLKGLR
jgi:glutamyl-tRNA synthetase